jgi:hypothetical protein
MRGSLPTTFPTTLARLVSIDTRALASFRIGAGVLVLLDLAIRAQDVTAFYTDSGVLPRTLHADLFPVLHAVSIHALFGSSVTQTALFVVAGVAAVALTLGYRTTLATTLSAMLLVSVQFRNPLILTAGDLILAVLLFCGIFLPLGARYSLDAIHSGGMQTRVRSVRTAVPLLFLAVLVYGSNAITHLTSESWIRGEAVKTVFGLDSVTTGFGAMLAEFPVLLTCLNWAWLGLLVVAPCLVLCSRHIRSALTLLLIGAHLGILMTVFIVTFPLANCVGLILFFPSEFWDNLSRRVPPWVTERPDRYIGGNWLYPERPIQADRTRSLCRHAGSVAVVTVFLSFVVWAVLCLGPVPVSEDEGHLDTADYPFVVFSPEPIRTDGWYVAPATLESGLTVDAYAIGSVEWDRPPDITSRGPRWTVYLFAGQYRLHSAQRQVVEGFADYLCLRTAGKYAPAVESVSVYFVEDATRDGAPTRRRLIHRACG